MNRDSRTWGTRQRGQGCATRVPGKGRSGEKSMWW